MSGPGSDRGVAAKNNEALAQVIAIDRATAALGDASGAATDKSTGPQVAGDTVASRAGGPHAGEASAGGPHAGATSAGGPHADGPPSDVTGPEALIAGLLGFLRRRLTGEYDIDVFGFDQQLTEEVVLPLARPLYHSYFRTHAVGLEHVPDTGGALLVANHAGAIPLDAIMTKVALLDEHPARRNLRELAADLALRLPMIGELARKTGNTLAHDDDAVRLLRSGELVGVWPEGYKGIGKPFRDRYKLARFGRGGYVRVALRAGVPIIPVAIVGSEETYPIVGNVRWLARLLDLPYFPITAQFPLLGPLGLLPLPSRWRIDFGEPIDMSSYPPDAADDPMLVLELSDRVRDTVQQMLYRNLMNRPSAYL